MRLIDADLLINCIIKSLDKALLKGAIREKGFEVYALTKFIEIVDAVPTEDPVKHGKWADKPTGKYRKMQTWCSECGQPNGIGGIKSNRHKPYCPNCGAKMEGEGYEN